jgi:hypothetical protein
VYIRNLLTKSSRQINLMILNQNLTDLLRDRIFAECLTLPNPLSVIADSFIFTPEFGRPFSNDSAGVPDSEVALGGPPKSEIIENDVAQALAIAATKFVNSF